jgi:hypothetical protein
MTTTTRKAYKMETVKTVEKPWTAMKTAGREMVRAFQSGDMTLYKEKQELYRIERHKFCTSKAVAK